MENRGKKIFSPFSIIKIEKKNLDHNFLPFFVTTTPKIFTPPKTRLGQKTHEILMLKTCPRAGNLLTNGYNSPPSPPGFFMVKVDTDTQ